MAARKLKAYVHVAGRVFAPGDVPPKEFADQITNPSAWDGDAPVSEGPDGDEKAGDEKSVPSVYAKVKVEDLKAEIEGRNVDREDDAKLSSDGNKAALIGVLEADDAEAAAAATGD